jgi:thymidylate synthase
MAIDKNDFSIDTATLISRVQAEDYTNRIYTNAKGNRSSVLAKIKNYKDNNSNISQLKFPLITPKYYMRLEISNYDRSNLFELNFNTTSTIILPMPNQLVDNHSVTYDEEQLGVTAGNIGNIGGATVKSIYNNSDSLTDKLQQLINQISNINITGGETASAAVIAARATLKAELVKLFPKGAEGAINALSGYSPNEFFTVLLKGPSYKKYTFVWGFYPKNKKESDQIKNIYYTLNNAMAVRYALGGAFWGFPSVFRLSYFPNSQYLNKFKPAVLRDLQINFAPGGSPAFFAGETNPPEAVIITATFEEMEYWLAGDFKDNNNPTDVKGPR